MVFICGLNFDERIWFEVIPHNSHLFADGSVRYVGANAGKQVPIRQDASAAGINGLLVGCRHYSGGEMKQIFPFPNMFELRTFLTIVDIPADLIGG